MNFSLFIAIRYLLSKKNAQAVSVILWIAIGAFSIASASMFVIMSVFSGLREMNLANLNKQNPDFVLSSSSGKTIKNLIKIESILKNNKEIESFSRVIDEKVYVMFQDKNQVAIIKGVDENFKRVISIDSSLVLGEFPDFIHKNDMILGNDLAYRLNISPGNDQTAVLYLPKKGTGIIQNGDEAFVKSDVYTSGILNENYANTIIVPIDLMEDLLESEIPLAYSFSIKLKNNRNESDFKEKLQNQIGENYILKNRAEQDDAFIKMMNLEQLMIYFIFVLIIIISSFNLAGAIIILILDKSKQNQALISMGFAKNNLRKVYFYLGILISFFGSIFGIFLGLLIVLYQLNFSFIKVDEFTPFPVKIEFFNVILVFFTILVFGWIVSYISTRKLNY